MHPECAREATEKINELFAEYKFVNFTHELVLSNLKIWLQEWEEHARKLN